MVRLAGLEPATLEFEARYSIQLSYKRSGRNCNGYTWWAQEKPSAAIVYIADYLRIRVSIRVWIHQ